MKCYRAQDPWAILGMWLYLFGMGGSYLSSTFSLKHHNPWKRRFAPLGTTRLSTGTLPEASPVTLIALRDEGLWGWGLFWFCLVVRRCGTIISFRKMKEHSYVETVCYILMGLSVLVVFNSFCRCARILLLDYRRRGMLYGGAALYSGRAPLGFSFSYWQGRAATLLPYGHILAGI